MQILARIFQILGLNGVPALGWFGAGWSEGTVIVVYWVESVLMSLLISLRILLHQRFTMKSGHFRPRNFRVGEIPQKGHSEPLRRSNFFHGYLGIALPFFLVQGLMLGVVLLLLAQRDDFAGLSVSLDQVSKGLAGVSVFLIFGFLLDLFSLKKRPFAWIRAMSDNSLGRVFIFQFTILAGLPLMAWFDQPRLLFSVFLVLKTMIDVGVYLPSCSPKEPPVWLCRLMDRIPDQSQTPSPGKFADYWKRDVEELAVQEAMNEEVVSGLEACFLTDSDRKQ